MVTKAKGKKRAPTKRRAGSARAANNPNRKRTARLKK